VSYNDADISRVVHFEQTKRRKWREQVEHTYVQFTVCQKTLSTTTNAAL